MFDEEKKRENYGKKSPKKKICIMDDIIQIIIHIIHEAYHFWTPHLKREQNGFKFNIFRKPTSVNTYIHYFSQHHITIKIALFTGLFIRALRICSEEFLKNEIEFIKNTAKNLFYPESIIEQALTKAKKKYNEPNNNVDDEPTERGKILTLPYFDGVQTVKSLIRYLGIDLIYSYPNTLKTELIKNSPIDLVGSIYAIPCKYCDKKYIGETGKDVKERIKEHLRATDRKERNNAPYMHKNNNRHEINWEESKNIIFEKDKIKRELLECCVIHNTNTFNLSPGYYNIDKILNYLFINDMTFKTVLQILR